MCYDTAHEKNNKENYDLKTTLRTPEIKTRYNNGNAR